MTDETLDLLLEIRSLRREIATVKARLRDARKSRLMWRERARAAEWACGVRTRKEKARA